MSSLFFLLVALLVLLPLAWLRSRWITWILCHEQGKTYHLFKNDSPFNPYNVACFLFIYVFYPAIDQNLTRSHLRIFFLDSICHLCMMSLAVLALMLVSGAPQGLQTTVSMIVSIMSLSLCLTLSLFWLPILSFPGYKILYSRLSPKHRIRLDHTSNLVFIIFLCIACLVGIGTLFQIPLLGYIAKTWVAFPLFWALFLFYSYRAFRLSKVKAFTEMRER